MVSGNYFSWEDGSLFPADVYLDGEPQRDVIRAIVGRNGEVHIADYSDTTPLQDGQWRRFDIRRGHVILVFGDDNKQTVHCEPKL